MNYTNKPTQNRNKGKQPQYKNKDVNFKKPKYKRESMKWDDIQEELRDESRH